VNELSTSSSRRNRDTDLVLGALAGKVDATTEIARTEKALVQVDSGALYFPIIRNNVELGGIFFGSGQLIVDAIVETNRGAVGQSQELEWNGSLLLLSLSAEWVPPSVLPASDKDLGDHNLDSREAAEEKARQLFDQYLDERSSWSGEIFTSRGKGWCVIILDKKQGKISIVASRDRLAMKQSDSCLVIKGNCMVKKDGHSKLIITGKRGHILRLG
jgi:hypothetical protein